MTGKEKLQLILDGQIPDSPPHWELVFQIENEMFGIDPDSVDFGFNDGPFISPEHFRDLVTPYLSEIVQTVHEVGLKIILHSDGCLNQILDQIHSTGIDGYQSVDPQGHMDIKQVRDQYPDWILMGNVACNMLQDTNESRIRESVQYCMTYGGIGKPYIFSTSNCIFKGMPPESYRIMLDEYHRIIMKCENSAQPNLRGDG